MTDEETMAGDPRSDGSNGPEEAPRARSTPPIRRHLVVLALAVVAIVVGSVLVVTGRDDGRGTSEATATTVRGPLLRSLGSWPDEAAAERFVASIDATTLRPTGTASTVAPATDGADASVDLSAAGLQRCGQAITQQNTDRSLGVQLASARLVVGDTPAFVVSYALPASGDDTAATRIMLVDARTCRVLGAVQHD